MNGRRLVRIRPYLAGVVFLLEGAHLLWQHFHGGVVSHHFLQRADMPAISNWWGLLVLPALTWLLLGLTQQRLGLEPNAPGSGRQSPRSAALGFCGALLLGILLSISFTLGLESVSAFLFFGSMVLGLLLPAYRSECLLGFVLGMAFTFGAVLPTVIGSVIAGLSAVIHLGLRPLVRRAWRAIRRR